MGNSTEPTRPNPAKPAKPQKQQDAQTSKPDVEINPGKTGNNTEVDLDKSKTKTYPPERQ